MILHKEYHKTKDGNDLKFTVTFNKERTNWATSQPKKIGYQVSVIPVKISRVGNCTIEESGGFTGFLDNLIEVDRQSAKRLQSAINELHNRLPQYIGYFDNKQ